MYKIIFALALLVLAYPATVMASEEDAVQAVFEKMDSALNSNDLDAFLSLFAESAVEMPPDEDALVGIDAIRERDGNFFENYTDEISSKIEAVQVIENIATVRISYREAWTPKAGGPTRSAIGKGIGILEKQEDNTWKVTSYIWNHDKPIE